MSALLHARVAEHEPPPRRRSQEVRGYTVNTDSTRGSLLDGGGLRNASVEPKYDVSAGAVAGHFDAISEVFAYCLEQSVPTCSVPAANTTQVTLVQAARYELRQGFLLQCRGVPIAQPFGRCEHRDQRLRHDEVADAERGEDSARERTDVDDAPFGIEALQGLQRLIFVAVFAVIVVLHDQTVLASGPVDQLRRRGRERMAPVGN